MAIIKEQITFETGQGIIETEQITFEVGQGTQTCEQINFYRVMKNYVEEIISKIKKILIVELPSKLNAIETEYEDDITLPMTAIYEYPKKNLVEEEQYLLLDAIRSTNPVNFNNNWIMTNHIIQIYLWLTDSVSADALTKKIYRYIRAIHEILIEKPDLDTTNLIVNIAEIDYEPNNKQETTFYQGASILLNILITEIL